MQALLSRLPFFVLMLGIGSAAMLVPLSHALVRQERAIATSFLLGIILGGMLTLLIGIATRGYRPRSMARSPRSRRSLCGRVGKTSAESWGRPSG